MCDVVGVNLILICFVVDVYVNYCSEEFLLRLFGCIECFVVDFDWLND